MLVSNLPAERKAHVAIDALRAAHCATLFPDGLPKFSERVLEVLRRPLEDKVVTISRATGTLTFPANFMLVAAMNACG